MSVLIERGGRNGGGRGHFRFQEDANERTGCLILLVRKLSNTIPMMLNIAKAMIH
jgi:hypothetical protein